MAFVTYCEYLAFTVQSDVSKRGCNQCYQKASVVFVQFHELG